METLHEEAPASVGARPDGTIDINAAMRSMLEGPYFPDDVASHMTRTAYDTLRDTFEPVVTVFVNGASPMA